MGQNPLSTVRPAFNSIPVLGNDAGQFMGGGADSCGIGGGCSTCDAQDMTSPSAADSLAPPQKQPGATCSALPSEFSSPYGNLRAMLQTPAAGPWAPPVRLYYNSRSSEAGEFGRGVSLSVDPPLAASFNQSYVDVTSGAGTRTRYFGKNVSNVYRSAGGIGSLLKKNAGGDWTESFPDGFKYNYTSSGLASSIVNPAGARWTIARDGGDRITSVLDPANQRTTFSYDAGFDCEATRSILRWLGIQPHIGHRNSQHGSHLGRIRWVVERTISWIKGLRRMRNRCDRSGTSIDAWTSMAPAVICFHILTEAIT